MAELSRLRSVDKLGSVMRNQDGSTYIGPVYAWQENDDGSLRIEATGPFDSASAYLHSQFEPNTANTLWARAQTKVMDFLTRCLPVLDSPPGFVICPPDFDSQNVMVDEQGAVMGIIDWDLAHTMPRRLGCASYPSWITRDWDPLMYGWPKMAETEDSPDALERYRAYYSAELGKSLHGRGDGEFTDRSHIVEAVWNAVLSTRNRLEICRKFVQVTAWDRVDALDVLYHIGQGEYSEEAWDSLKASLTRLIFA